MVPRPESGDPIAIGSERGGGERPPAPKPRIRAIPPGLREVWYNNSVERRNLQVPRAHAGEAVARILRDGLEVAHSVAKGLIDEGCVTINGRPATSHGQRCQEGDVVEVRYDPTRRYHPRPAPRPGQGYRVVHEDYDIVVVDKTPGLLTSPAPNNAEESLAERIAGSLRERGIRKPQVFVVHRLDKHTSGLLVLAKTQRALESLAAQFESREAGRVYVAVVEGRIEKARGSIISHLTEDPRTLTVRTTPLRGAGKRAVTHFEVVERLDVATLVRVRLETGRKHQIRVHFAEIGHPIVGDRRYGRISILIQRVALHAERLEFRHPKSLGKAIYEAPWPDDLNRLLTRLRRPADPGRGAEAIGSHSGPSAAASADPAAGVRAGTSGGHEEGARMGAHGGMRTGSSASAIEGDGPRTPVFPKGLVLLDEAPGGFLAPRAESPRAGTVLPSARPENRPVAGPASRPANRPQGAFRGADARARAVGAPGAGWTRRNPEGAGGAIPKARGDIARDTKPRAGPPASAARFGRGGPPIGGSSASSTRGRPADRPSQDRGAGGPRGRDGWKGQSSRDGKTGRSDVAREPKREDREARDHRANEVAARRRWPARPTRAGVQREHGDTEPRSAQEPVKRSRPDRAGTASGPNDPHGAKRKPWEFRQKGSTLRRARRQKIAAAQSKHRKRK